MHVVKLLNRRAGRERAIRFIKVLGHRGEPLNELADSLAVVAAESDSARSIAELEAVYFLLTSKETWVEWDARIQEDLVQRAAEQYVTSILRPKRGPPALPFMA